MKLDAKSTIEAGKAILGIELGSTRIKAVLIDQENKPIAQGSHTWENQLVDGLWTYSVEAVWYGLQDCYADLRTNVKSLYDTEIETLAAIGCQCHDARLLWHSMKKKKSLYPSVPGEILIPARLPQPYPNYLSTTSLCVGASPTSTKPSWIMKSTFHPSIT